MKKFMQFVLMITILFGSMSISYAWDAYVYNKTKYNIRITVWENNLLSDSGHSMGSDMRPGENEKLSTRLFFGCFAKADIRIKRVRMDDVDLSTPYDKQCVNRRLEIEQGNDDNTFTVKWVTQW